MSSDLEGLYANFANDCYDNDLDLSSELKNEIKEIIVSEEDIDDKIERIFSLMKATAYEW